MKQNTKNKTFQFSTSGGGSGQKGQIPNNELTFGENEQK